MDVAGGPSSAHQRLPIARGENKRVPGGGTGQEQDRPIRIDRTITTIC